jgi:hypothetical protein
MTLPRISVQFGPAAEPLLERVPTRDEFGKPLSDLMMLLPGLRDQSRQHINGAIQDVHDVLDGFPDAVVFAEFNVKRNMLWISVRPVHGIRTAIATAIRERVPEAKLVSHL